MNIKKTRVQGLKTFQLSEDARGYEPDEETVKEGLIKKSKKEWIRDLKQNKANIHLLNEEGEAYQGTTFHHNRKIFAGIAPNLVQAYFDLAYEHIQWTDKYAETFHFTADKKFGEILQVPTPQFHRFLQYKISSIVFLHLSVEAFINHIIPDDFIYEKIESKGGQFLEQSTKYSKTLIEKNINFKEKIEDIVPQIPNLNFDKTKNQKIIGRILEVVKIRDEIIHLKSKNNETSLYYQSIFHFIASRDLNEYLYAARKFINIIEPDFIKYDSIKENNESQEVEIEKKENLHIGILFEIIKIKNTRITIYIRKWKGLTKNDEKLLSIAAHLDLMERMNIISDYLLTEKKQRFILEVFKREDQIK